MKAKHFSHLPGPERSQSGSLTSWSIQRERVPCYFTALWLEEMCEHRGDEHVSSLGVSTRTLMSPAGAGSTPQ